MGCPHPPQLTPHCLPSRLASPADTSLPQVLSSSYEQTLPFWTSGFGNAARSPPPGGGGGFGGGGGGGGGGAGVGRCGEVEKPHRWPWLPSDCLLIAFWLHMITRRLPDDCPFDLLFDCFLIATWLLPVDIWLMPDCQHRAHRLGHEAAPAAEARWRTHC